MGFKINKLKIPKTDVIQYSMLRKAKENKDE